MPCFSVIIPTYNRARTIVRALQSVLQQTYTDFDVWVVDDGSTDCTEGLMGPFLGNTVHYIKQKNNGVSHARNTGIIHSKGKWLAFLDSDDQWLPHKLQEQREYFLSHSTFSLVHGEEIWMRNGRRVNAKNKHQKFGGNIYQKCLPLCLLSPSSVVIKRDLLLEFDCWDEEYEVCEDYFLWLKIAAKYPIGFIENPLIIKYGGHDDQLSRKYFAMDFWRVKALKFMLAKGNLSEEDREATRVELQKKAKVLLQGYLKHNNLKDYEFIKKVACDYSLKITGNVDC